MPFNYNPFTGQFDEIDDLSVLEDNLADALSFKEGANPYQTFITTDDEEDVLFNKPIDIRHTATAADDHALEIDMDAAALGDIKAVDIDYITGQIDTGQDEGIILINIDETLADGGDVFALEVLATDGSANIHGLKVGPVVGAIHQDSGTFANPTLATNNTPTTDVEDMRDGVIGDTTAIFQNNSEYIIIGAATAFQDIELIFSTPAGKNIKPTFSYSKSGGTGWTDFTPVDGTDGCKHTGVISWDASDLTGHVAGGTTGTFDIRITRTKNNIGTTPILGYAKTAVTTEYVWDKDGNVNINDLAITGNITMPDDGWIGLGSAKGRIEFDDQTVDEINFLDCHVGIGTSTPAYPLDIEAEVGSNINAKFGASVPLYIKSDWPGIGFNLYHDGAFKLGKGSSNEYGGMLDFDPTNGQIKFYITAAAGNADDAATANVPLVIDNAGNIGFGSTSSPTFGTSAAGTIGFANGTAPSADIADQHAYYSADLAAGNAAPHWRTENGTIITLNQGILSSVDVILQQQVFNS